MAALEVLALNTVIPQIQAPQVGDTYLFPRAAEFSAGTQLLPSLAGPSDLDTGMWFPAANTVAWSTGGSERMRITSAGEVGIGKTAATGVTLDVNGIIHAGERLQLTNGFANVSLLESSTGVGYRWALANNGTYRLQRTANGTYSDATTPIIFDASNNVGIGQLAPGGKLHIRQDASGAVSTSLILANPALNAAGTGVDLRFYPNDGQESRYAAIRSVQTISGNYADLRFFTAASDTPVERLRIAYAGNVGIGETEPDYKLDVNGTFGFTPGASVTPVDNGDVVFEATNNTTFTVKLKGSDGTVRTGTITLA